MNFSTPISSPRFVLDPPPPPDREMNLRLSGLPRHLVERAHEVVQAIVVDGKQLYLPHNNPAQIVKSTALWAVDGYYVATVRFRPSIPFCDRNRQLDAYIIFENHRIRYDEAFFGFTPLASPGPTYTADLHVQVVTGLGGRPIDSWKSGPYMWPRDSLAQKLSDGGYRALITTYGYRSSLQDTLNNATFDDYAHDWLDGSILVHRRLSPSGQLKPLFLVASSFGGLVVKRGLMIAFQSKEQRHRNFLDSIAGTLFLGVPNLGLDIDAFLQIARGQSNERLIELLRVDSMHLQGLDRDFTWFRQKYTFPIIAVHEVLQTATHKIQQNGTIKRNGPPVTLVSKASANSPGLQPNVQSMVSFTDHGMLAKFGALDDPVFYAAFLDMIQKALRKKRWYHSQRFRKALRRAISGLRRRN